MRITILVCALMALPFLSYSQFPEGFEGGVVPPTGWAVFDNGTGTVESWDTISIPNSGTFAAAILWENVTGPPGTVALDWLVTPQFTPTASVNILSFFQRQGFTIDYGSVYTVRVSTNSQTNPADFDIVDTQVETDFGLAYSLKTVDLSAYNDTPIYVAFVMANDDGDAWLIDDVDVVTNATAPDCASNPSPPDGATDLDCNFTFSWDPATTGDSATSFEVYASFFPDPDSFFLVSATSADSLPVTTSVPNDTIYWQVIPVNVGGPATGCPVWFVVTGSSIPPEDVCSGAIEIPVPLDSCISITTLNNCRASDSDGDVPAPPAATCTNYAGGDVWAKFEVPSSGNVVISGAFSNCCSFLWYELYSGSDCSALTSIGCSNTNGNDPSQFENILSGLTPGDTIWIRAWDSSNDNGPGDFNLCVYERICVPPTFTVGVDGANCPNFRLNVDVTDLGSADTVDITNDYNTSVFESVGVGNYQIGPVTNFDTTVTIYIFDSADSTCIDSIAVSIPGGCPPENDNCAKAVALIPDSDTVCDSTTTGTLTNATQSGQQAICPGEEDNDVWFTFTATAAAHIVDVTNITGSNLNLSYGFFTGNCDTLSIIGCTDVDTGFTVTGLTVGSDYFIQVYTSTTGQDTVDFDICVQTPDIPSNDSLCNAIPLTVNAAPATFTNEFAAAEANESAGVCWFPDVTDVINSVWFSFVAPNTGVIVNTDFSTPLDDVHMQLFSLNGSCSDLNNLIALGCGEDEGDIEVFQSIIWAGGLTPGNTYYIQVDGWANLTGTFSIEIQSNCNLVMTTQDSAVASLRFVLDSCGVDTVGFAPTLVGDTLNLESTLCIQQDVTIQGPVVGEITVTTQDSVVVKTGITANVVGNLTIEQ